MEENENSGLRAVAYLGVYGVCVGGRGARWAEVWQYVGQWGKGNDELCFESIRLRSLWDI